MYRTIVNYCEELIADIDEISEHRKLILNQIISYIKQKNGEQTQLIYVCTHNSRRSHFGQVWATVAASFYNVQNVKSFSAGTEKTAFHPNAIAALKRIGFVVEADNSLNNPKYRLTYGDDLSTTCFSKTIGDKSLPKSDFATIMTCEDAEKNCPFLPGAEMRIATTYQDPKAFDGTSQEAEKYDERYRQIALETLYVFSKL
jgi:protein-tyrosine phosphatase/arsenate reductase